MEVDKSLDEEEEEEEKEHFFSDFVPPEHSVGEEDDEEETDLLGGGAPAPSPKVVGSSKASSTGHPPTSAPATVSSSTTASASANSMNANSSGSSDQERRAQISASPYITPFTPLSSPPKPKTPSSSSNRSKKLQLVPMKDGSFASKGGSTGGSAGGSASGGSTSSAGQTGANSTVHKFFKQDGVGHLPKELVDTLFTTLQTLDKMILKVEDFKTDQVGFMVDKAQHYVDLLKQLDTYGAEYHAAIPLKVFEVVDGKENTNPELFTKQQLEICQDQSIEAKARIDSLELLKKQLELQTQEHLAI